jgi:hypothetical protein
MSCHNYVSNLLEKLPLQVDAINTCAECDNKVDIKLPYLRPTCHSHTVADYTLPFNGSDEKITEVVFKKKTPIAEKDKFVEGLRLIALTEKGAKTYSTSENPCLDFLFQIVESTDRGKVESLLTQSWEYDPLTTLKLIANLGDVRHGKSIKTAYLYSLYWLYDNMFSTLSANLKKFVNIGCWKDLLHLLMMTAFNGHLPAHLVYEENLSLCRARLREYKPKNNNRGKCYYPFNRYYKEKREYDYLLKQHYGLKHKDIVNKYVMREHRIAYAKFVYLTNIKYRMLHNAIAKLFADDLYEESLNTERNSPIGLACKWGPSLQKHHDKYTLICTTIANNLADLNNIVHPDGKCLITQTHLNRRQYFETIKKMRKYNHIVESVIPLWSEVRYEHVPSKSMSLHKSSFLKHDTERFTGFVNSKETKAHGSVIKPYEFVSSLKYSTDDTLVKLIEKQWENLVSDFKNANFNQAIAVCDVSGSMSGAPINAAIGLTLLTMELINPPWSYCCITFDTVPQIFKVNPEWSLSQRIQELQQMPWGYSTNIDAVFTLILDICVAQNLTQEQIPKTLFIFTDMEFDVASEPEHTNIEVAKMKFAEHGYILPRIVFWNLRDSSSIPITATEKGVMVSGFSGNLLKLISGCDLDNITPELFLNIILETYSQFTL